MFPALFRRLPAATPAALVLGILPALICLALSRPSPAFAELLRYGVFPAPPYMIYQPGKAASATGLDVDIVNEIAGRLGLRVVLVECPWVRCLKLMEQGEIDILSSAYKKPDREAYMAYLDRPYLESLPVSFYYRAGENITVDAYEDLVKLTSIGVLRGASYFEQFDADTSLRKYEVTSQDQLFPMLLAKRFDVLAGYVPTENYRLIVEGYSRLVAKTAFEWNEPVEIFLAVSRKSPFISRLPDFDAVNRTLIEEGFVARTVQRYSRCSEAAP